MAKEYLVEVKYQVWVEAKDADAAERAAEERMPKDLDLMSVETKDMIEGED